MVKAVVGANWGDEGKGKYGFCRCKKIGTDESEYGEVK